MMNAKHRRNCSTWQHGDKCKCGATTHSMEIVCPEHGSKPGQRCTIEWPSCTARVNEATRITKTKCRIPLTAGLRNPTS